MRHIPDAAFTCKHGRTTSDNRGRSRKKKPDFARLIAPSQVGWAATNAIPILAVNAVPDPRATFLLRAAARWELLENGEIDLDEAFNGLIEHFEALVHCQCDREIIERWERACPPQNRGRR